MTKQYVITDPCYIIDDNTWSNVCNECFDDSPEQYENFNKRITQELNKLAGTTNAIAVETGFGDWSNSIHATNGHKVLQSDFFADSGMVCVVEYNDKTKQAFVEQNNEKLIERGGCALIETEGDVIIKADTSDKNWTIIEIDDDETHFYSDDHIYCDDEDYDDEWIEDDEYYEDEEE